MFQFSYCFPLGLKAEQIANRESEEDDEEDYCYEEIDPMLKKKLLQVMFDIHKYYLAIFPSSQ